MVSCVAQGADSWIGGQWAAAPLHQRSTSASGCGEQAIVLHLPCVPVTFLDFLMYLLH